MSDLFGNPLRKPSSHASSVKPPAVNDDEESVDLLDNSAEPTDDSPTIISKTVQPQNNLRPEDATGGGLRGRRLAHFELIEPIGVGGMAAVLRARDTQLDRLVALKILPPEMAVDPENVRRFHQEARSAARLDHENIARVFFCGEDQRLHFIAFEYVEGDNLRTVLEKRGRLPVGEALHYMLQVAAGLAHAAGRGVVHRDIKPSNIIITPNGRAKLVDMGLARSLEPQHDMGLTQSGVTLGTFDYISPEQALEPREADVRSDIYSLGCTFYHMLTGRPPVPEGTAAKKLHHHQHVKPTDPRQFVPDLPDEAAVILDRMMAKQPKDRYQTPEHLVHHLYLAASKLGAAAEVPEGVLTVEAALPSPPRSRPLVLAALAALAVVGLIFLVDTSSTTMPEPSPNPALVPGKSADGKVSTPSATVTALAKKTEETENPLPAVVDKKVPPCFNDPEPTVEALEQFLRKYKAAPAIVIELNDLDLSKRDDKTPDLVIANPTVTIRPLKRSQRPIVRDQYHERLTQTFQPSLTIRSESCTIENIRFVLDQNGSTVPMAMLWFDGTREARLYGCEFIQAHPGGEKARMASVLAQSDQRATLTIHNSCFLGFGSGALQPKDGRSEVGLDKEATTGGQDAVARRGPVRIDAQDCVFGPHAATFRLEGRAGRDDPVRLNHCSVQAANQSAVFDVIDDADAAIELRSSLISNPSDAGAMGMAEKLDAVLVRRAASPGQITYRGYNNRYHHLDSLVGVADAMAESVQPWLDDLKKNDGTSRAMETFPWKDPHPLDSLKALAIQNAFEINPLLRELRGTDEGKKELIGSQYVLAYSYLDHLPPLPKVPEAPPMRERIVEIRKTTDSEKRLYPDLEHALLDVQPGETIRLRRNGDVKLDPSQLRGKMLADVTLRADTGFHPILTLNTEEQGTIPALFEIYNGRLQLEGLEVRLKARRDDDWCAVVSFFGEGECVLKDCVITLERSNQKTALAVLPERRMKKSTSSTRTPRLTLENCFIRGYGNLIDVRGGSCLETSIEKSLIVLSGSLLNVESDKQDGTLTPPPISLRLHEATTYLTENLIRLRAAKSIKGLAKTICRPSNCLFLPAGDRASVVRLEGPETEENGLRNRLSWESGGKNAYGTFTDLFEFQSIDSMKMPLSLNQEKWKQDVSGETDGEYNVKLSNPPAVDVAITQLMPSAFRCPDGLKDYGVDPRFVPKPQGANADTLEQDAESSEADFDQEVVK